MGKVGIDIGGTKIEAVLVENGKIIAQARIKTQANKSRKVILDNIAKAIFVVKKGKVSGIGIGIPGRHKNGKIIFMPNIKKLVGFNLQGFITKKFNCKTIIENDAVCFALGEHKLGAGRGCKNIVGITLGTGIGGGIIVNGKPFVGNGFAGEIGHMAIDPSGIKCGCGRIGDLESWCSGPNIMKHYWKMGGRLKTTYELFSSKSRIERKAQKLWMEKLATCLTSIANILNPDTIILGGGLSSLNYELLNDRVNSLSISTIKIVKGKLNNAALGASCLI